MYNCRSEASGNQEPPPSAPNPSTIDEATEPMFGRPPPSPPAPPDIPPGGGLGGEPFPPPSMFPPHGGGEGGFMPPHMMGPGGGGGIPPPRFEGNLIFLEFHFFDLIIILIDM